MRLSEEHITELIEKYLDDEISGKELSLLKGHFENDDAFEQNVQVHKDARGLIDLQGLRSLYLEVREDFTEVKKQQNKRNSKAYRRWFVGLIVLCAINLALYLSWNDKESRTNLQTSMDKNTPKPQVNEKSLAKQSDTLNIVEESIIGKKETKPLSLKFDSIHALNVRGIDDSVIHKNIVSDSTKSVVDTLDAINITRLDSIKSVAQTSESIGCPSFAAPTVAQLINSCYNKNTGSIILESYDSDLIVVVEGMDFEVIENEIVGLGSGKYNLYFQNKMGCNSDTIFNIQIGNVYCTDIPQAFTPSQNDFKLNFDEETSLKIYDRNGTVHYQKTSRYHTWNGTSFNGNELSVGRYFIEIVHPNGQIERGKVIIVK